MRRRAREILAILCDPVFAECEEDVPDLICEGNVCYFGNERVRRATVDELLMAFAISHSEASEGCERFVVNSTGEAINRRPELEREVFEMIRKGGAYSIINDRVVDLNSEDA